MSGGADAYTFKFLTEEWVWEEDIDAPATAEAISAARDALEQVVREERPELACVTVMKDGVRLGVWDWVGDQGVWTADEAGIRSAKPPLK